MKFILFKNHNTTLIVFVLFVSLLFVSCGKMITKAYGIKNPKKIEDAVVLQKASKNKIEENNLYYLKASYKKLLDSINGEPILANTCSKNKAVYNLSQPIQALFFKDTVLIAYYTNCYAGGFPNLKWNRNNSFESFPPKGNAPIHEQVKSSLLVSHFKKISPSIDKTKQTEYTIIVFWNCFMYRQSRRLIKEIKKSLRHYPNEVKIYYVNNDNYFAE